MGRKRKRVETVGINELITSDIIFSRSSLFDAIKKPEAVIKHLPRMTTYEGRHLTPLNSIMFALLSMC